MFVYMLRIYSRVLQELEEKLARREEATEVAMTMQSQISKYYDIECENSKLKEENSYLKYVECHIIVSAVQFKAHKIIRSVFYHLLNAKNRNCGLKVLV